jgi:hypothetical protein
MAVVKKKSDFIDSEEGLAVRKILEEMTNDVGYHTVPTYNPNIAKYPDNEMTFTEKHLAYISSHPELDTRIYLSNLKLMTKISK